MRPLRPIPIYLILCLFLITGFLQAQMPAVSEGEIAGISSERLERYAAFLQEEIATGKIPGAVSLIMRNGKEVQHLAFGYRNTAQKIPMQKDDIFYMMSMTKPVVSVALLMLYEEGHFFLNDPVSKYLPGFNELQVALDPVKGASGGVEPARSEITIHQLLTHTAGFSHGLGETQLDKDVMQALYLSPQASLQTRVQSLLELPLVGHPGEQWYYSAATDVVSLLVEHFSGMPTAAFLKERLFIPLNMSDTGYNLPESKHERRVPVHQADDQGLLLPSQQQFPLEGNTVFGGTHGLFSTAADYLKFCRMLLNEGAWNGHRFLSPKTIDLMTRNHVGDLYGDAGQGFGLGFGLTTDLALSKSLGSEGRYYWSGAYCTYFFIDPKEDLIAILLTQLQPYSNFYGKIAPQLIYQAVTD